MANHRPAFDGNFVALIREITAATRHLDALPDDTEWTQDELATIDDLRHASLRLAQVSEATIETVQGDTHA